MPTRRAPGEPQFDKGSQPSSEDAAEARPQIRPEDVIDTETLDYLVEGVRVRFVPLAPEELEQAKAEGRSGWYTKDVGDPRVPVKEIHYNPEMLVEPARTRATALHEALHHAKPVVALSRWIERAAKRAVLPEPYAATDRLRSLAQLSINAYLGNGVLDRVLEYYAVRKPYRDRFLPDFQAKVAPMKDGRDLTSLPLPKQFIQALLGSERFFGGSRLDQLDPRVSEALDSCAKAIAALDDVSTFEHPFRTELDEERAVERKGYAFEEFLLPSFLKLLEAEAEDRKKQEEEKKDKEKGEGEKSEGGDSSGLSQEQLEALSEMLEKLIQEGKANYVPPTAVDPLEELLRGAKGKSNELPKPSERKPSPRPEPGEGEGKESEVERRRREAGESSEAAKSARSRGTAERVGVPQEAVRAYDAYVEHCQHEIARLRDAVIAAMSEERRAKLGLTEREGEVTPGLEGEAITAAYQGDHDERVHLRIEKATRFSKVRLLFVVDVSGSMGGKPMDASRAAFVIINEAFREAKEELEQDALIMEDEEPLEIGVLAFEGGTTATHPIGAPLDDRAKYRVMSQLRAGGGTNDYEALVEATEELDHRAAVSGDFIDLVIVLSDGEGDEAQVRAFCDRVRVSEKFSLGAFGFGSAKVRSVYGGRPGGMDAVFGDDFADPPDALPQMTRFIAGRIEREIERRQTTR